MDENVIPLMPGLKLTGRFLSNVSLVSFQGMCSCSSTYSTGRGTGSGVTFGPVLVPLNRFKHFYYVDN